MHGENSWEFKLDTSPKDHKDKGIGEKARELVNKMRLLLGDGDYEAGTKIWYEKGFERLFYQLLDKENSDIYREIEQGFPFKCLEFLEQKMERAEIINQNNRKKKKRRKK